MKTKNLFNFSTEFITKLKRFHNFYEFALFFLINLNHLLLKIREIKQLLILFPIYYIRRCLGPKRLSLCHTRRGLDKGYFYFKQIYILQKIEIKKFESIKFFKICYEYIKNNSYINLGDEIHIRIAWPCSNAVKTHNVSYI